MQCYSSSDSISASLKEMILDRIIDSTEDTAAVVYDYSILKKRIQEIKSSFPVNTLSTMAIKANPFAHSLQYAVNNGMGLEAATLPELHMALATKIPAELIVFDSPAKTVDEITFALEIGCNLNADSFYELERINKILTEKNIGNKAKIGVRINPQVGMGSIAATSVAGHYSKFGISINRNYTQLIQAFKKYEWLTGVHVHIGSQGCKPEMLINGLKKVYALVKDVEEEVGDVIDIIDLGGGLPVSYYSEENCYTVTDYAIDIKKAIPELFSGKYKLVTEFGRYINANAGWTASRVEYVKEEDHVNTACIHVGADMFIRKCYNPDDWHHDLLVCDSSGVIKSGAHKKYNIAGPLCFAGDMIAREVLLPQISEGDILVIKDTGAYTVSMWSRYNTRQIPKIIGMDKDGYFVLRDRESVDRAISFWK